MASTSGLWMFLNIPYHIFQRYYTRELEVINMESNMETSGKTIHERGYLSSELL